MLLVSRDLSCVIYPTISLVVYPTISRSFLWSILRPLLLSIPWYLLWPIPRSIWWSMVVTQVERCLPATAVVSTRTRSQCFNIRSLNVVKKPRSSAASAPTERRGSAISHPTCVWNTRTRSLPVLYKGCWDVIQTRGQNHFRDAETSLPRSSDITS